MSLDKGTQLKMPHFEKLAILQYNLNKYWEFNWQFIYFQLRLSPIHLSIQHRGSIKSTIL